MYTKQSNQQNKEKARLRVKLPQLYNYHISRYHDNFL